LCTSPMRRARETVDCIASVTELTVQPDTRPRERLNWDGSVSFEAFLALWACTRHDRDFAPGNGESSRQAGVRLQAFLAGLLGIPRAGRGGHPRRDHDRPAVQPPWR
jgi:broad specificity phosphatase PhoE